MNGILLEIDNFDQTELAELHKYVLTRMFENANGENDLVEFISHLVAHPDLTQKVVKEGEFFRYNHEIRTCPRGGMNFGGCDDCYSWDTDADHGDDLRRATQVVFESMPVPDNGDDSEYGEESEYCESEEEMVLPSVQGSPLTHLTNGDMVASQSAQKGIIDSPVLIPPVTKTHPGPIVSLPIPNYNPVGNDLSPIPTEKEKKPVKKKEKKCLPVCLECEKKINGNFYIILTDTHACAIACKEHYKVISEDWRHYDHTVIECAAIRIRRHSSGC